MPGTLSDDSQICSCNNITKGEICAAIRREELTDVAGVKAATRAGTVCGSCVPLLPGLLAETGVSVRRGLCEHFTQTRAELFELVRTEKIATFTDLIERYGTGRGCDICKPAIASILAGLGRNHGYSHILDGEQAALQDTNDHFLANLQKNGTYSVVPRIAGGEVTPEKLIVIGEVARDFGLYTKITGGQRIDLFGARVEQLPAIWRRLVDAGFESGHAYGKALRTVKSCVGSTWCRYGVQDSVSLAIELELRYRGIRAPHKIKAGVSGCARECAEAQSKDIGVIATETRLEPLRRRQRRIPATPRAAAVQGHRHRDADPHHRPVHHVLHPHRRPAAAHGTLGRVAVAGGVDGLDYLRAVLIDDALGIAAELDAAIDEHVANYADEWAAVLDDPERLRRFVSFVNAPDTPDPSITFVQERGSAQARAAAARVAPAGFMTTLERLGTGVPLRAAAARARRGRARRRAADRAVPHLRRAATCGGQPRSVHRCPRDVPRDRRHPRRRARSRSRRCTSRPSTCAPAAASTSPA